jgi:hypothetical protein
MRYRAPARLTRTGEQTGAEDELTNHLTYELNRNRIDELHRAADRGRLAGHVGRAAEARRPNAVVAPRRHAYLRSPIGPLRTNQVARTEG